MTNTLKRSFAFAATVLCALALSSNLCAQTPCEGSTGPDVIVGDITGPANYGAVGTLEALALGTTSCNMGTVNLNWHSNTNQHPVIGGELYRYKIVNGAGQFDQLGISWLKHGFYALSDTLCCSGCHGTDGSQLGVRCSDPYTAERNGAQSLLGPRYQVNAHTGFFTYPPPTPSGGNNGRIQVDTSELEATSGGTTRYFANCQYVAADDSAAGNDNNNASYREMSVSGSGNSWTFGFIGSTHRESPAIKAWAACESGVTVNEIQLPGEGRIMFAYKATDLGNGQYHYEYVVYNMNSAKSLGSFSVPVPSGVALSNVGFNDITYRGGDGMSGVNFDGTDWAVTRGGSDHTWATIPFAQNPNANAIRFGSAYSFRFDANAAPVTSTITIGTFKDAGSVQTTGDVPGGEVTDGTPFCFGDGLLQTFCPCFNFGNPDAGCANSVNPGGAKLTTAGTASPDTIVFTATGELPTALSIVLQGTNANTAGFVFGDGLRCVTTNFKRLYVKNAIGGVVTAPSGGDLSVTARSAQLGDPIAPGSTRNYQIYYRDSNSTFCVHPPDDTFNVTNAIGIVW